MKTISIDFDGVIHSYSSLWRGPSIIPDPPVPGAIEFIKKASKRFKIVIHSTRATQESGVNAIKNWLEENGIDHKLLGILVVSHKTKAVVYIDDRAWRFEGSFPSLEEIDNFKPWNKK